MGARARIVHPEAALADEEGVDGGHGEVVADSRGVLPGHRDHRARGAVGPEHGLARDEVLGLGPAIGGHEQVARGGDDPFPVEHQGERDRVGVGEGGGHLVVAGVAGVGIGGEHGIAGLDGRDRDQARGEARQPFLTGLDDRLNDAIRAEGRRPVGFLVQGPGASLAYVPDIDKWERWDRPLEELLGSVDVALVDGTFFADGDVRLSVL